MPSYNDIAARNEMAAELPESVQAEIIGDIETRSTLMRLGRRVPVLTRDSRVPVLAQVPSAYWVQGDTGFKGTTKAVFEHEGIVAEEIATILPIPDAVIEDADFDLFDTIKPLVARAFARVIDQAALFGVDKPASWGPALIQSALAGGNIVTETADPVSDLLSAAELVANDEYSPTGAVVRTGWEFGAARSRVDAFTGSPLGEATPFRWSVGGLPIMTSPVAWDRTAATAIVADWENVIYGVRRKLTFEFFKTGVLTDPQGNITVNLLTQDTTALRCSMRMGFLLAKPATQSGTIGDPVSVVVPSSASS